MGLLIAVMVTVYAIMPAAADSGKHGAGFKPDMDTLTEKLALTEEQAVALRTILEEQRDKRRALIQQLKEETDQRLATVLSAEQLQEFQAWSEERRQHMRERGGRRGHERP
jgi:Spy/CpxP family protein refolding chaperone